MGQDRLMSWHEQVTAHDLSTRILSKLISGGWQDVSPPDASPLTLASPWNALIRTTPSSIRGSRWASSGYYSLTYLRLTFYLGKISSQFLFDQHVPWIAPPGFHPVTFQKVLEVLARTDG
jgi:hypothetical protein